MAEHQPLNLRLPTPGCYADADRSGLLADDVFDGMTEHLSTRSENWHRPPAATTSTWRSATPCATG
jgi:hypothetical protein